MQGILTLDDLPAQALGSGVTLVRVDFNVPLAKGKVLDATRLEESKATIEELRSRGARLLLASHCGRPRGRRVEELSLRPLKEPLEGVLGHPVLFVESCVGPAVAEAAERLAPGEVCLLENLRFHPGEESNDEEFAAELARPARCYVDDAFGSAHRNHASVVAVARRIPQRAAGRLMAREVEVLSRLLDAPAHPFATILGGAKVSGKIATLQRLIETSDRLLIAGGMANTFLRAKGLDLGRSLVEEGAIETAKTILTRARERQIDLLLPSDVVVADQLEAPTKVETVPVDRVPPESMAVDIGPETVRRFRAAMTTSASIFWNGPCGVFEVPPFDGGSLAIARGVADSSAYSVVGGGETAAVVARAGIADRIDHLSTGGGASLALLAGKPLPALEVLRKGRG